MWFPTGRPGRTILLYRHKYLFPSIIPWKNAIFGARDICSLARGDAIAARLEEALPRRPLFISPIEAFGISCAGLLACRPRFLPNWRANVVPKVCGVVLKAVQTGSLGRYTNFIITWKTAIRGARVIWGLALGDPHFPSAVHLACLDTHEVLRYELQIRLLLLITKMWMYTNQSDDNQKHVQRSAVY